MSWKATVVVCLGILAGAAAITALIYSTEPEAQRETTTRETAMLVEVVEARRGSHRPQIVAQGVVRAARDVVLAPRVSGEIVERAPRFDPGGFVEQGEVLLRIDPDDYRNALQQRQSELARALAGLEVEKGRQDVAERDYRLLGEDLASGNEALVLREPQLRIAQAAVESARAAAEQAQLELDRTTIRAPFDAHVLTREVDLGSQVEPGQSLGRIVGLGAYWVVATVPLSKLRWVEIPGEPGAQGSHVVVRDPAAWAPEERRVGSVSRLIGSLDERTRLARVLVTVEDPLARGPEANGAPAMMIGAFVEARIVGREITDVVRLARGHVRQGDTVWVMEDGVLRIRKVTIPFMDSDWAYVSEGLAGGERVVTTDLSTVVDGAPLRLTPAADGDATGDTGGD